MILTDSRLGRVDPTILPSLSAVPAKVTLTLNESDARALAKGIIPSLVLQQINKQLERF